MSPLKSLLAASILLLSSPAIAQVTYTDVDPDVTISEWAEHFLQIGPASGDGLYIWKHPNEVVVNSMVNNVQVLFDGELPASLEYGETIGSSGTWKKPSYAVLNHAGESGNWLNVEDRYLGLRYKDGTAWHYAWARLDIDQAPSHFTLKDYAVETTAGAAITAGAESSVSGVHGNTESTIYFVEGQKLTSADDAYIAISSTLGEQLFQGRLRADEPIDLSGFGKGCLFIRVSTKDKMTRLKIFIGG